MIEYVQPDAVFVQSSPGWWNRAKLMRYVDSQEEYDQYSDSFKDLDKFDDLKVGWMRKLVFWPRMAITHSLFQWYFGWSTYKPWKEGLEVKFACEAAEDTNAQIEFFGNEWNKENRDRVAAEHRFSPWNYLK